MVIASRLVFGQDYCSKMPNYIFQIINFNFVFLARHITPMASHARDLLSFKYYRDTEGGKREIAEKLLKHEPKTKINYFVSASKDLPGKFMLSYMPR